MIPVDGNTIRSIAPRFGPPWNERQANILDAIGPQLAETLERYEINTVLRIAHFLAQCCHESAGFRTTEEFATGAAYEGRRDLGNTQPGDGMRYKGRGIIQLTGRANYRRLGEKLGIDLENDPAMAAEPLTSLTIACEFWKAHNLNNAADRDDINVVTRIINGGYNGLDDRKQYLVKAKAAVTAADHSAMPDFSDVKSGVEK